MKSSGIPLNSLPPKVRAQVEAQLKQQATRKNATPGQVLQPIGPTGAPRLRQSAKAPNKTEAAFAAHVRACYPSSAVYEQAVTLVLANGLRYTPDVFLPGGGARPAFYEVKGFMRSTGAAKVKMAARVHAWADFFLVTRRGRTCGGWDIQVILR